MEEVVSILPRECSTQYIYIYIYVYIYIYRGFPLRYFKVLAGIFYPSTFCVNILFTKLEDVLPQDRVKSRDRKIRVKTFPIAQK